MPGATHPSEDARQRTKVADRLCETLGQHGWNIFRDSNALRSGDLISGFMKRIGLADHVIVVLSDTYLRSPLVLADARFKEFLPILTEVVAHRRKLKKLTLADLPLLRGVEMRRLLDGLLDKDAGFSEISHHGLRTAWTTAALSHGKITETFAKRFVNYASTEIHEIYQRIGATDLSSMFISEIP